MSSPEESTTTRDIGPVFVAFFVLMAILVALVCVAGRHGSTPILIVGVVLTFIATGALFRMLGAVFGGFGEEDDGH